VSLNFEKWHGIGNDFVLLESVPKQLGECDLAELARFICDRKFGVGADGLLLFSESDRADARMVMLNPDGTEAEMCGNGLRCFGKWFDERAQRHPARYQFQTGAGDLTCDIRADGLVAIDIGHVELLTDGYPASIEIGGHIFEALSVSVGNPHLVIFTPKSLEIPLEDWGPKLEYHPAFSHRTNVHFVSLVGVNEIRQITWERGAGRTMACGTGACASAYAAKTKGLVGDRILVHLPGGDLQIEIENERVTMVGPAERSFTGSWLGLRGCWPDED